MASNHTKVTAPSSTRKASPPTGPASTTAAPSPASKSILPHWSHKRGSDAEERVANHFIAKKFVVLKRRYRTQYAEIDLLIESPRHEIWILEIKTLSHFAFLDVRVSWKQKERLKRAHLFVQARTHKPVRLALVFVDARGEVLVVEDF